MLCLRSKTNIMNLEPQEHAHHRHRKRRTKSEALKTRDRERSRFERLLTSKGFLIAGLLLILVGAGFLASRSSGVLRILFFSGGLLVVAIPLIYWFFRSGTYSNRNLWYMIFSAIGSFLFSFLLGWLLNGGMIPGMSMLKETSMFFFSGLSLCSMAHAKLMKYRPAMLISLAGLVFAMLIYSYLWVFSYFSACFIHPGTIPFILFLKGAVTGLVLLVIFHLNIRIMKHIRIRLPSEWFSQIQSRAMMKGAFILVLYLWGFWLWNEMVHHLITRHTTTLISLAVYTYGFDFLLIRQLIKKRSSQLEAVLVLSFFVTLGYFLVEIRSVDYFRNMYVLNRQETSWLWSFMFHYAAVVLLIFLLARLYHDIRHLYGKFRFLIHALQSYIMFLMLFIILQEYDNIILLTSSESHHLFSYIPEQLAINHRMPWSLLAGGWSLIVLVYALIRKHRFLRLLSILLFVMALVKIIAYDVLTLSPMHRIVILFILGGILILFALIYPRLRHILRPEHRRHRLTHSQ